MSELPSGPDHGGRTVYVVPEELLNARPSADVALPDLIASLWKRKWTVIVIAVAFGAASVAYALLATEWYRAEMVLAPAEDQSGPSIGGQLGGLAALAGVNVSGSDASEAIATLKSSQFAARFIEDLDLVKVFFADDWDPAVGQWRSKDPETWPDVRDAVKYLHEEILRVNQDPQTGLVTLSVDWTDPIVAAEWAGALVSRLNEKMRKRALLEAESNVKYLQSQLEQTSLVTLQQSIGRLMENELQKAMLARGNEEFAFRVIDSSGPPKERVRPKRTLLVILGTLVGGLLGVIFVLTRSSVKKSMGSSGLIATTRRDVG